MDGKGDSYYKALRSRKWSNVRKIILKRDGWKCTACGSKKQLCVHHTFYYEKYTEPYDYPLSSLITLCEECHNNFHKYHETPIRGNNRKVGKNKPPKPLKRKKYMSNRKVSLAEQQQRRGVKSITWVKNKS
jgi:5-methylcytosine-specific restriction endonuclease McrA